MGWQVAPIFRPNSGAYQEKASAMLLARGASHFLALHVRTTLTLDVRHLAFLFLRSRPLEGQ